MTEKAKVFLKSRQGAYAGAFRNPHGEEVLRDLAKFCRAHESTFSTDDRASALLEGRREVWLRIQHHLQLSEEEMWDLYQLNKR